MNDLIVFSSSGVALTPTAMTIRETALATSALIGEVTDAAQNAEASNAMMELKRVMSAAEASRKAAKAPYLDAGTAIDQAAKDFIKPVKEEYDRIERASADYATAELERVRAQERARRLEEERIQRERQRDLDEIERKRKLELEQAQAIQDEQARQDAVKAVEAEAANRATVVDNRAQQEIVMVTPAGPATPEKADGQIIRPTWNWEVVDVWLLARMHPGMVEIKPRRSEINEALAAMGGTPDSPPKINGLRVFADVKVGVRLTRSKAIDV